jgi:hypothetical protein
MPDPIRCTVDPSQASHTVTCEPVEIGPEPSPSASPPQAAAPPPAPSPQSAAVAELVKRFPSGQQREAHAPKVDTLTLGSAERCLGELAAVPLVLGVDGVLLPAATAFKVSYDVGACLAKEEQDRQLSADRQVGIQDCESQGGAVIGEVGHTLICERSVPEVAP